PPPPPRAPRRSPPVGRACSLAHPRLVPPAEALDEPVGLRGPPRALRVRVDGRRRIQQRLEHAPGLLAPVLAREPRAVAAHRRIEQDLVRGRTLAALQGELHVEVDGGGALLVGPVCL